MQFDCCFHMPFDCWDLEVVSYLIIISYWLKRRRFYRSESFIGRCFTGFSMEIAQMEVGYIELLVQLG
jgi:hypothetical protein